MKTSGQIAYEAFCSAGRKIPETWETKDRFERLMWEAVGNTVAISEREACAIAAEGVAATDNGLRTKRRCVDAIRARKP